MSVKSVVVTGVSSGIGLAIAEDLLGSGYRVFGSVRRVEDADGLKGRYPSAFVPLIFDVTDTSALPGVVAQVQAELGGEGLTALVNNAGISISGPLMHQPLAEIRQIFEVNVLGTLAVTQAFLGLLGAHRDAGYPPGRVVNIGSVAGVMTTPFMAAYSASKHALEALTQGLRRELSPYGIEVAAVEPSFIPSRIFEKEADPQHLGRYADTDYAAIWQQFNRALQGFEASAKPVSVVTRAVRHAIESAKPRTRYPLDWSWYAGRWLPDRGFDQLIFKAFGITRLMQRFSK